MGYSPDLSKISIDSYKEILKNKYLLPSRRILHQDMDSSFDAIHTCQIKNLVELKNAMSTTQKLHVFSEKSGLSKDYLTILRREIGSIEPKIVLIKVTLFQKSRHSERRVSLFFLSSLQN